MATLKQQKAFKTALENGGNVTAAMKEVKYSEKTIHNPSNLTESRGWQELMEEYLPDESLAKKHKQFLNSKNEFIGVKSLDMGYKLKGSYAPEKSTRVQVNFEAGSERNSELEALRQKYEDELRAKLIG